MRKFVLFSLLASLLFLGSCLKIDNQYSKIAPGIWRGTLQLTPKFITPNKKGEPLPEKLNLEFDEVSDGELPFFIEVKYATPDSFYMIFKNGSEEIIVDDIQFGLDRSTAKDTLVVEFPHYDTYIKALVEGNIIQGTWHVPYRGEYEIPFIARFGKPHHFSTLNKAPIADISGRWAVNFAPETEDEYPAIGEFKQNGNVVTGTFLTETGDFRYLSGEIQGDKLYLSTFDGAHAFLFEAKIKDDNTMIGAFRSGKHYQTTWEATRNSEAKLADAEGLTKLVDPTNNTLVLNLTASNGEPLGLTESDAPVKIVQIMGTWCPNCYDETQFLLNYRAAYPDQDIAIFGVAFENYTDTLLANEQIQRYKKKMEIPYPIAYGGKSSKKVASEVFSQLTSIQSFPTMLILNQDNEIMHIHTGFSGPATSEYALFSAKFSEWMKELLEKS